MLEYDVYLKGDLKKQIYMFYQGDTFEKIKLFNVDLKNNMYLISKEIIIPKKGIKCDSETVAINAKFLLYIIKNKMVGHEGLLILHNHFVNNIPSDKDFVMEKKILYLVEKYGLNVFMSGIYTELDGIYLRIFTKNNNFEVYTKEIMIENTKKDIMSSKL